MKQVKSEVCLHPVLRGVKCTVYVIAYMDGSVEIRASGDFKNITDWCTPAEIARLTKSAVKINTRVEAIVTNRMNEMYNR